MLHAIFKVLQEDIMTRKIIRTEAAPQAIGPYSQAVEAGGFVFVSGQIPIDPETGHVLQGDMKSQAKQVMENAKAILLAAGCSMPDVVKSTIYLKNMTDFAVVNDVYGGYFLTDHPARATVEVSRLPKDVDVEMDFVAWKT
jgi:2-iminobutanoate/2-iminopropanoate deaminase